ncbi:MAG: ROK family protein [Candidatus Altiarchaeales archaeon]|nr:ROK family protein [Candidatus Altiarchaeales archaeon]
MFVYTNIFSVAYILGVDISGTQNVYSLAELESAKILRNRINREGAFCRTGERDLRVLEADDRLSGIDLPDRFHTYLCVEVESFLAKEGVEFNEVLGVGLSVAGKVYEKDGDHFFIGGNTPKRFASRLQGKLYAINATHTLRSKYPDTPVFCANDCNCTAIAQSFVYGRGGVDPRKTFYVTISTGFGGGGLNFEADELGHNVLFDLHPAVSLECSCGMRDCVEVYASGEGLVRLANRLLEVRQREFSVFSDFSGRFGADLIRLAEETSLKKDQFTTVDLFNAAESDGYARFILDYAARLTAHVLVNAAQIHDLEVIGIGGGVGENQPGYVELIDGYVQGILVEGNRMLPNGLRVEVTPLGTSSNDWGALTLAVPEKYQGVWAEVISSSV